MTDSARLRREHGFAAALLALLLNVMFFPYLWGNMNLMSGANDDPSVTALGGPNGDPAHPVNQTRWKMLDANGSGLLDEPTFRLVHHEVLVDHDVPLWNPDAAFGTPLAAAMQQQPFYPLTAVVMLHPSPTTFAAYILLRLFVAGFATYLFLRFFVGFLPALGGGIAFMLNGYFFKYETMPHLSVETLTGALFLGVELVLRRRRPWLAVPFLAAMVWFDFLGGMPESSFISIVFAFGYGLFRVATVPAYRRGWFPRLGELGLSLGCGFACAAFLLLPFAELVTNSFNVHEPSKNGGNFSALVADSSPPTSLAIYALPLLFGPPWEAIGIPFNDGYFGVVIIFLALAAVAYALLVRRSGLTVPIGFFAVAVLLLTAKRYGLPAVNWIGALPIVRVIALTKYQEAATAFGMAPLVAFGLHALTENTRRRGAIAFAAFLGTLGLLQLAYNVTVHLTSPGQPHAARLFHVALLGGLAALFGIAVIAAVAAVDTSPRRSRLYGSFAILALATEMSLNYFVPMYYFVDPGPSKRQNPYLGAAYIDFLHAHTQNGERVYAERTAVLEPDWSQAFDLKDIRDIDAIYDDRYLPFARAFLPKENHTDLLEDYSGAGDFTMATPIGQRMLALGAVRYIVTGDMQDPTSLGGLVKKYVAIQSSGSQTPVAGQYELGGQWLDGFSQARPAQDLSFPFDVPRGTAAISLAVGVDDTFWSRAENRADARLQIADARGVVRTVLQRRFDGGRPGPRGWERHEIDVRRDAGTQIRLILHASTSDPVSEAVYWGDLRTERAPGEAGVFTLARHYPETNVYAFAHPLPHGALFENVTLANDDKTTLDTLTSPGFDVFASAVISRDSVPAALADAVGKLVKGTPSPARGARLDAYTATRVSYSTDEPHPALLFLSDTFYPGWKAYVDARETPILRTNYLFRGVVVGPGKHVVEFRYEPSSFRLGLALCAGAFVILAVFGTWSKRAASVTALRSGTAAPAAV